MVHVISGLDVALTQVNKKNQADNRDLFQEHFSMLDLGSCCGFFSLQAEVVGCLQLKKGAKMRNMKRCPNEMVISYELTRKNVRSP